MSTAASDDPVPPPWVACPDIERFSIGWRMGRGESLIMAWQRWWERGQRDEAARLAYFRLFPPPTQWLDWTACAVWPAPDDDPDDEPEDELDDAVRRLAAHGIGDHAAWRAWMDGEDD